MSASKPAVDVQRAAEKWLREAAIVIVLAVVGALVLLGALAMVIGCGMMGCGMMDGMMSTR